MDYESRPREGPVPVPRQSISPAHEDFGRAVRGLRLELGLSQERLALESGIDRSYVGAVERGERNLGLANVFKLAAALGVQASELHIRAEAAFRDEPA